MKLHLTKPLVIFDLETTGLDLVKDRIIQISFIKVYPDGSEERGNFFVNPGKPIPHEVTELTGITDEKVKEAPSFKELAPKLYDQFKDCDFAGFNSNRFDVPMLAEEFLRASTQEHIYNIDFNKCRLIDVQTIFHRMEPRNLAAAYRYYCGRKMEDDFVAHNADQDTEATYRVLQGQLDMYAPDKQDDPEKVLHNNMDELAEFSKQGNNVDFAGRIVWKQMLKADGTPLLDDKGKPVLKEIFNFGKHKGELVSDVLHKDPGFYSWIMSHDFTLNTKQVLARISLREKMKEMKS